MLRIITIVFLFVGLLEAGTINVAIAANVSYVMDALKAKFQEQHPQIDIAVTLGSSGKLAAQIQNGAPFELFMAADMKFPQALYGAKLAVTKPKIYAQGSLAYLSSNKQEFSQGIELLKSENIKKIAIANPKTAPYGAAAVEAIKNASLYDVLQDKFVYAESISQAVAYTTTAADIGIVAKSSLYDPKMSKYTEGINWASVDTKLYTPINQGVVILKNGVNNQAVEAFYNFLFSQEAKKIFENFGYFVP